MSDHLFAMPHAAGGNVPDDVTLSARVPADLRARYVALAATRGVTLSDLVRAALEEAIRDRTLEVRPGAPRDVLAPYTLDAARRHVRQHRADGVKCPCCGQLAREYRRALGASSAAVVVLLHAVRTTGYVDLPALLAERAPRLAGAGGYATLGKWWGLLEQAPGARDDGSNRTGLWRITELGRRWADGAGTVQRYARLFDGELLGLEGPPITVHDALGTRFDYRELLAGQ
jgi:antitoxin component of RelBE/YafQ-DinJ toxin-antitoxin module